MSNAELRGGEYRFEKQLVKYLLVSSSHIYVYIANEIPFFDAIFCNSCLGKKTYIIMLCSMVRRFSAFLTGKKIHFFSNIVFRCLNNLVRSVQTTTSTYKYSGNI